MDITKENLIKYYKSRIIDYENLNLVMHDENFWFTPKDICTLVSGVFIKKINDEYYISCELDKNAKFKLSYSELSELVNIHKNMIKYSLKTERVKKENYFDYTINQHVVIKNEGETDILKKYEIIPKFKFRNKQIMAFSGLYEDCLVWIKKEQKTDLSKEIKTEAKIYNPSNVKQEQIEFDKKINNKLVIELVGTTIDSFLVINVDRPTYILNKGWNNIDFELLDLVNPSTSKKVFDEIIEKGMVDFTIIIKTLDGVGSVIETWELFGDYLSFDFGGLTYEDDEIVTIKVAFDIKKCSIKNK